LGLGPSADAEHHRLRRSVNVGIEHAHARPFGGQRKARFTAVVDFPTPPLPDATATMFFTRNELDPALHRMGNDLARDADVHGAHARHAAEFSRDEFSDRIELGLRGIAQLDLERDAAAFHFDVSRRLGGEKNPCPYSGQGFP